MTANTLKKPLNNTTGKKAQVNTGITKKSVHGEVFLALAMLLNSLAVTLMIKADFGLSALSAVPYTLHIAFPALSLGTWNTVMQCFWLVMTMVAIQKWKPGYLFSFVLAFLFGLLLDAWAPMMAAWGNALALRLAYFTAGFFLMSLGISLFFLCSTPVLPFDTVPRAFVMEKGLTVLAARLGLDLLNLAMALVVALVFVGRVAGIGVGTVVSALLMGVVSSRVTAWVQARYQVEPYFKALGKLV